LTRPQRRAALQSPRRNCAPDFIIIILKEIMTNYKDPTALDICRTDYADHPIGDGRKAQNLPPIRETTKLLCDY
jgi:hypothetical protein